MTHWRLYATLPWTEPLELAARAGESDMALLYSSLSEPHSGDTSFLFLQPLETIAGDRLADLPKLPATSDGLPLWVGYLGYELSEHAGTPLPSQVALPALRLTRFAELYRFHHLTQTLEHFVAHGANPQSLATPKPSAPLPKITSLASNFTRAEYEHVVADTVAQIHAGNFYQANITRKFWGEFETAPDSFALFQKLCTASPAPYSAYIRHEGSAILSSSPECFLRVEAGGRITTRPIKGSARRGANAAEDAQIQQNLKTSQKNHAENLMIVDLMRNDLARVSTPQSVRVTEQSALYSYATIHHLISTITAQKQPEVGVAEVISACFPPGSMTGAPKIAAMRWCAARERLARGVYSGAIGWLGGGDACDLSVVIRTLLIHNTLLEFQVGGGIVADSTAQDEWRETIIKARGIMAALGIAEHQLEEL